MKKLLSLLIVLLMALLIIIPVSANSDPSPTQEPVVVEEEETPKAAKKKNNTVLYVSGLFIIAVVVMISNYQINIKTKPCELSINNITDNGDGSYTVMCTCTNPNRKEVNVKDNSLRVIDGSAIILQNNMSKSLKPNTKEDCLIAVVNEESKLEWQVYDQKMIISGKVIKEGEKL